VESIELIEIYLVPSLVLLVPTQERIGIGFTGFQTVILGFSPWRRGLQKKMRRVIDRARRDLYGTIIGFFGTNSGMNRHSFYSKFRGLGTFWDSNFGFSPWRRGPRRKMKCSIDRARRDLYSTIIGFVGTNSGTNRHRFYWF
jgi:hypothetical protein